MKKFFLGILVFSIFAQTVYAAKTTYIATNKRFNYVKLRQVSAGVAEELSMSHPKEINVDGLKAALASIKLSRTYLIKKEVDTQQVFDERAIEFLAPNMVRAFAQANPMEKLVISYLSKDPIFILRNDRLNIADCWISGNELHVDFKKLFAKITGDIDKRGNETKAASRAKGLRVRLELGPGQKMAMSNPEEIILDLDYNYVVVPETKQAPKKGVTMTGEEVPLVWTADNATTDEPEVKPMSAAEKKTKKKEIKSPVEPTPPTATIKERLEKLDELKKAGLINKQEYTEKKAEILRDL